MSIDRRFSFAAVPLLVVDPYVDQILDANQEACRLLQMDALQIQSQRLSGLFSASLPDLIVFTQELLEMGRGWCDHLLMNIAGDVVRLEVVGRCSTSGEEQLLHLSLQPAEELDRLRTRSDAQRHYLSGIGHWDRVSRVFQEFERENHLLLEAAGEGIYGVDANGLTTFVNQAAQHILGYSAEELAGRNMHSMVHHSHRDGSHYRVGECPIFKAFHDGAVRQVDDDIFWSKSGQPIDVEYTSTPIEDNGFVVGAVVVFRDVSQKKADHQRLVEALEEVERLKQRLEMENAYLQEELNQEFNHHQIIGKSGAIQNVIRQIELVAPTDATVLIHGESGTGKELIARAIHDMSQRSERPLIRVNCAAIPEDLFESEFFGHTKGAFTGATSDRPGRFELADGGTLFLDEVGEIPLHLQGKLLRVLQEQQFERVGDSRTRHVDVRIITATNRDLAAVVQQGKFREDLYFRLNVFPIVSVPLRQRSEDIPLLVQHFLQKACRRANKPGLKIPMTQLDVLKHYHWPGNIRELENVLERQVILAKGDSLVFDGLLNSGNMSPTIEEAVTVSSAVLTQEQQRQRDKTNIMKALKACHGKVFGDDGAAALLGMKPTTLASRIKKYAIDSRQFKTP